MIKSFTLKAGRGPGVQPQPVEATPVTVFVGPNNSGKSKVLREIYEFLQSGQRNEANVVLGEVKFESTDPKDVQSRIESVKLAPGNNETVYSDHVIVGKRQYRNQVPLNALSHALIAPDSQSPQFCQWFLACNTLMLDGQNRIQLVNAQGAGDLQAPPTTSFQVLFRDDQKRSQVRKIVHDAFGVHLVVDPTNLGSFRLRLSDRAPSQPAEERGIDHDAVAFHSKAIPIESASDGVKAFVGMISEIVAGDPVVMLADEPEAFLHPSLAFALGREMAVTARGSGKRLFVSTHSPNLVMGCIQSGVPVNIVRLTYRGGVATSRVLGKDELLHLMRNPLLRSTGVLGGLFYEFVVVTESDADRAFYQEVNDRLLRHSGGKGIPNCLFLNAQNKQTVHTILRPLRALGIPAVGIVDVDILKEGGKTWTNFLEGGVVPSLEHQSLGLTRSAIKAVMDSTKKDMKREGGLGILAGSDLEAAQNHLRRLEEYGLFVVPGGELESWLKHLGAAGHGPTWLVDIFERMGEDPHGTGYIMPGQGDVWDFIASIRTWLTNPIRRGIPS